MTLQIHAITSDTKYMKRNPLPRYFSDEEEFQSIHHRLKQVPCPQCGSMGTLNLHGPLRGYVDSRSQRGYRGHRIYCSKRYRKEGCGHTFSILKSTLLRHLTVSTLRLWQLILHCILLQGKRPKVPPLSKEQTNALLIRIRLNISRLRTVLDRCSRPPPSTSRSSLFEVLYRLQDLFTDSADPIASFQHRFQVSFL